MRRLCAQLILVLLVIPAVVHGDNPRIGIPEVEVTLGKANKMAETLPIPSNSTEVDMTKIAEKMNAYYRSPDFQGKMKNETERIKGELFGHGSVRFYPDSTNPAARGKLTGDERIYIFISSAMPLQTVRNYAASVAQLGDPNVTLVMRGFVDGMSKIQPTIRFIGSVLQRDPACNPAEGECEMLSAGLAVDPLLFRRYAIDRVPAVVYAKGLKTDDAALSEGDAKNTSITEHHTTYGDTSLEYLIEQIQKETGSHTLAALLATPTNKK